LTGSAKLLCTLLAVGLIGLTACSSSAPSSPSTKGTHVTSHLTHAQASAQIHAYMRQTLAALPHGADLQPLTSDVDVICSDDDGAPPSTPVTIRPAARLTGIPATDFGTTIDSFVAYWRAHDWRVTLDQRPKDQYVVMKNNTGFELFLQVSDNRQMLSLGASTPCVPPKDKPTTGNG
jgi:hypothetical protein